MQHVAHAAIAEDELHQRRHAAVAPIAEPRHAVQRLAMEKARAFGDVDVRAGVEDAAEARDERRIALVVRGDDADRVDVAARQEAPDAGDDRATDALVRLVDDLDLARMAARVVVGDAPGGVGRAVVDDDEVVDERQAAVDALGEELLLVEGRHHEADAHLAEVAWRRLVT